MDAGGLFLPIFSHYSLSRNSLLQLVGKPEVFLVHTFFLHVVATVCEAFDELGRIDKECGLDCLHRNDGGTDCLCAGAIFGALLAFFGLLNVSSFLH
jgi:hypothetical protein